jgi:hypothetical protein
MEMEPCLSCAIPSSGPMATESCFHECGLASTGSGVLLSFHCSLHQLYPPPPTHWSTSHSCTALPFLGSSYCCTQPYRVWILSPSIQRYCYEVDPSLVLKWPLYPALQGSSLWNTPSPEPCPGCALPSVSELQLHHYLLGPGY